MARLALTVALVAVVFGAARGYTVCNDFTYTVDEKEEAAGRAAAHGRQQARDQLRRGPDTTRYARHMDGCSEAAKQCVCTREHAPVCGDDGVTYGTYCLACCSRYTEGNEALTIATDGECAGRRRRHSTRRHRRRSPMRRVAMELCRDNEKRCLCPRNMDPVCGDNGKTYSNFCMACCGRFDKAEEALTRVEYGRCASGEDESGEQPRVQRHASQSRRSQPRRFAMDECRDKEKRCSCFRHMDPVCGDNGETYGNFCKACCDRFDKGDETLTRVEYGRCGSAEGEDGPERERGLLRACTEAESKCVCPHVLRQVCGNNGHTYSSFCNACCEKWEMGNDALGRVTPGICPDDQ